MSENPSEASGPQNLAREWVTERLSSTRFRQGFAAFVCCLVMLLVMEGVCKKHTRDGLHFQDWSSDDMMQTLPATQLQKAPLSSLWYLHKQPPAVDAVRAAILLFLDEASAPELIRDLDTWVYRVNAVFFAALGCVVFLWLYDSCGRAVAWIGLLIWAIHPAAITNATFLEGTMLSAVVTTLLLRELVRIDQPSGSVWLLALYTVAAFYTRTVFQWYFPVCMCVSLFVIGVSPKRIGRYAVVVGLCIFPFMVKQQILFGTVATTTFGGEHKLGILWYYPSEEELREAGTSLSLEYPSGADECARFASPPDPFNTEAQARTHLIRSTIFSRVLTDSSLLRSHANGLLRSVRQNATEFWEPTASYYGGDNDLVKRLPWTGVYNGVFSDTPYKLLIAAALLGLFLWSGPLSKARLRAYLGVGLVLAYVLAILHLCNRYEWTEGRRLKFILEPSMFVLIVVQAHAACRWVRGRRTTQGQSNLSERRHAG
ncbi:hypothetical protein OAX78_02990 [Planctomycetota bacterium]|nr:hypothetical protein [Planctomycetota bacterium]